MPSIPTVPGSFRVNTPEANVKADFGALDQANQGAAAQGAAMSKVGGMVGDFGMQLQQAKNYGIAADADRQMRQASADFQAGLVGRTDEDNWTNEWNEKADALWGNLNDTLPIAPAMKQQMAANFKLWKQSNGIEVRTLAQKQSINRAVERIGLDADEAAKDGGPQAEAHINGVFDGAVEHKLMLPEVAEKAKRDYLTKIDEYAGKNVIMSNPAGAVDYLEAKDEAGKPKNLTRLSPDQRMTLLNAANTQFTKYQTDNFQNLIEDLQNGVVKAPEELSSLVAQKVISPRQRKTYETAYRHGKYNTDVGDIGGLFTAINNYDPTKDPDFTQRAKLMGQIATSGFPTNVQSDMNQLIGQKSDSKSVLNSPIAKDTFQGIDQRFELGLYGKWKTTVPDKATGGFKTITDAKAYESAMVTKRQVEDAARRYITENPTATAEDVNHFVSSFQMDSTVRAGRNTVLGGIGLAPTSAEAKKALLDAVLDRAKKK